MSFTEAKKREREEGEVEIRLSDIVQFLKDNRRRILVGSLIGILIGGIYAFSKPNLYTAEVTVLPEIQARGVNGFGGLGSLAGLAGLSLDNIGASDAIRPDLYPNVLQSIPFALSLLKQPVYSQKLQAKMPLQEFLERMGADSYISRLMKLFVSNEDNSKNEKADLRNFSETLQVTKKQDALIDIVQASTTGMYDKKTGIITVTAVEPDPIVAATVARLSLEYLTHYITTYRTEKARKQVTFLTQRVEEAKVRYQSAEYNLSNYRDRNRSLFLNTAKLDEQRIQADYILQQSVYNELSKQLEQAKIKVQEETPVFKVLEPPTVPLRKSGPKRTLIMVGFGIVGGVMSMIIALIRHIRSNAKTQQVA
jgi:uncharacterized protein involved in exopolysaccharide biosynthesis